MKVEKFKVLLYLKKSGLDKNGKAPIMGRVVAADDQHGQLPPGQTAEKAVKQGHRLGRGHALVIHVPGDEQGVRPLPVHDLQGPVQDIGLVLQHRDLADPLAQVQVG